MIYIVPQVISEIGYGVFDNGFKTYESLEEWHDSYKKRFREIEKYTINNIETIYKQFVKKWILQ